ncbi:MAG: pyridoxamine 5'-phosphate oxidase family protein [Flavobacteriaceae bacterium]|nr:pyridoxamine 5'-phosphate oxidase family protein [Flavobacteriaceae bacterium]
MRKLNQEINDPNIIEEILKTATICRIAMVDNGKPYIIPLNYGFNDGFIYIHSAPEGKKIEILKENNQVCFEIESTAATIKHEIPCKWSEKYRSIIGYGTVEFIHDSELKKEALEIIMKQHGATGTQNFEKKQVEFVVILKVKINQLSAKQSSNWR